MIRLLFLSVSLLFCSPLLAEQRLLPIDNPRLAPELDMIDSEGKLWKLEDLKGKPAIVNFWATWCPPCRKEMPSMERAWESLKDDGIQMIAINFGQAEEVVDAYLLEHPLKIPVLLDPTMERSKLWRFRALPTTYILNKEGMIVNWAVGPREWDDEALLAKIRELL